MCPSYDIANNYPVDFRLANNEPRNSYYNHEILFGYHHLLYGLWTIERIWGGGNFQQTELNYEYLEFAKYGIFGKINDNQLVDKGMIKLIYRQAGSLIICLHSCIMDEPNSDRIYNVYLTSDTLILEEPCCDGFSTLFTRAS